LGGCVSFWGLEFSEVLGGEDDGGGGNAGWLSIVIDNDGWVCMVVDNDGWVSIAFDNDGWACMVVEPSSRLLSVSVEVRSG